MKGSDGGKCIEMYKFSTSVSLLGGFIVVDYLAAAVGSLVQQPEGTSLSFILIVMT